MRKYLVGLTGMRLVIGLNPHAIGVGSTADSGFDSGDVALVATMHSCDNLGNQISCLPWAPRTDTRPR